MFVIDIIVGTITVVVVVAILPKFIIASRNIKINEANNNKNNNMSAAIVRTITATTALTTINVIT